MKAKALQKVICFAENTLEKVSEGSDPKDYNSSFSNLGSL